MFYGRVVLVLSILICETRSFGEDGADRVLRAGLIGLDTSHVVEFTKIINRSKEGPASKLKVVAAFPAGSPGLPISANRIEGFTKTLRETYGVEIVGSIDELVKSVDVVLLESVDGRTHLEQARQVIKARKPLFVDKPIAASLADAIEIFELADKYEVPCFSSSSKRFSNRLQSLRSGSAETGKIVRCDTTGPISTLKGHPDLAFYGIHGIEMLFTVMGPDCETVTWQKDGVAKGKWADGSIGSFSEGEYLVKVVGTQGTATSGGGGYGSLVEEVCAFLQTGKPPVSSAETIAIMAFIEAAQQSKDNGHVPVAMDDVMAEARRTIADRTRAK
jgi:hypothetical protein